MSSVVAASSSGPTIAIPLPGGGDISKLLKSQGPVVTAVLLKADGTVNEISIDTTPQKQMVQHVLGGPFTFLGQYEDEGTVLMCRKPADDTSSSSSSSKLVKNTHTLQPPLDHAEVHGDVLILKVAASDEDENEDEATIANAIAAKSNEEFFLHYSKDEYIQFAARTDIEAPKPVVSNEEEEEDADDMEDDDEEESDEVEEEGESDEEDDEEPGGFLELLMGQVMQRFQQDNGRMPDEQELAALQSVIAQKMGGMVQE